MALFSKNASETHTALWRDRLPESACPAFRYSSLESLLAAADEAAEARARAKKTAPTPLPYAHTGSRVSA